jgi:protein arginine kinase
VNLNELAQQCGIWLAGNGPESDIVISSRIRLARNFADYPFIRKCNAKDQRSIIKEFRQKLKGFTLGGNQEFVDLESLEEIDRQFLMERQIISRELSETEGSRGVLIDNSEQFSVMVNEEDHLRIQIMQSGLDLKTAWKKVNSIDDAIESQIKLSFSDTLGYLTACPTNVGTGLRVSVMLHLPALVVTKQMDKVFRSFQRINVAVRGLFGEGSQFMGDFYQVSNQITLGRSEEELIQQVREIIPVLIEYERKAREFMMNEKQRDLHDDVSRALGILSTARKISSEETMSYLSKVRLGVNLKLISDVPIETVNKLFIHTQPAHLQKISGRNLTSSERNVVRADYLQQHLLNRPPQNN